MTFSLYIIALFVSAACAIPGVFLVLRRMSLMSDAISHAVLPGIVIGFLFSGSLSSPLLIVGAVAMGMVTVVLTEGIAKTGLVKNDAAIGIVFPALFSVGVILVSMKAGNVHLDTDSVLSGELVFATLDQLELFGYRLGPRSAWTMGAILLLNVVLLLLFFKELKLATFDPGLAASLGLFPTLIHYGLMIDVSITAVGAFDSVGSILVVALMIAPAAAAYLLTDNLKWMLALAVIIGAAASVSGVWIAKQLDASFAGGMAGMAGILFLLTFLFAPSRGMVSILRRRQRQKIDFGISMLSVHILHHRQNPNAHLECHPDHLQEHINWETRFAKAVIATAQRQGYLDPGKEILTLTEAGEKRAQEAMAH